MDYCLVLQTPRVNEIARPEHKKILRKHWLFEVWFPSYGLLKVKEIAQSVHTGFPHSTFFHHVWLVPFTTVSHRKCFHSCCKMWIYFRFTHGDATPHFLFAVREFLNEMFPEQKTTAWPARYPDFDPLHFYIWSLLFVLQQSVMSRTCYSEYRMDLKWFAQHLEPSSESEKCNILPWGSVWTLGAISLISSRPKLRNLAAELHVIFYSCAVVQIHVLSVGLAVHLRSLCTCYSQSVTPNVPRFHHWNSVTGRVRVTVRWHIPVASLNTNKRRILLFSANPNHYTHNYRFYSCAIILYVPPAWQLWLTQTVAPHGTVCVSNQQCSSTMNKQKWHMRFSWHRVVW